MASKQPFRIFDWKQKITRFYLRLNKTLVHKVMSKSRNALIIDFTPESHISQSFGDKLRKSLKKTWQIYDLDLNQHKQDNFLKFSSQQIQQQFANRQYDSIIVLPHSNKNTNSFHNIDSEQFAVDLTAHKQTIIANMLAYRLANKYLTTSGVLILSNSQSDFAQVENKTKVIQKHMKNITDAQISYLGVVLGDRDYTDLNSWSVVALSEQYIECNKNSENDNNQNKMEDFVVQMYANWANGNNLPMPGSFALFKEQADKKKPFVQYL